MVAAKILLVIVMSVVLPCLCLSLPSRPKDLVIDTDVDTDDVLALLYLLKHNHSLVNIKAITVSSNAWVNPGFGVNIIYDILHMMSRDDVEVGVGGEGGIDYNGTIYPNVGGYLPIIDQMMSTAGLCRYRQAIPPGMEGGSLDVDTNYGLRREFLPQGPRRYVPGRQKTAQEVMVKALANGSNTVLLLGSHTNFALLLETHPHLKSTIEHVYIMGGAESTGNIFTGMETDPFAEYNIFMDPFAAHKVLDSGLPITLVPLEATNTVPVSEDLISALERNINTPEANYTYYILNTLKQAWPKLFSQIFYMWDSFTASVAVSGMLSNHSAADNEFAVIGSAKFTVVTSNKPYGVHDFSNPIFDSDRWIKFNLIRDGVHSGHVQTGLQDPFCYVPERPGTCMDGRTLRSSQGSSDIQVALSAREDLDVKEDSLVKKYYSSFLKLLNSPHQTASPNPRSGTQQHKELKVRPHINKRSEAGGKAVIFDMDISPGDILALLFLLKAPRVDLKAVTVTANGWSNAAAIDIVYDVLHMMGRDDIPVGLGAFFAMGQAYLPRNITGGCKFRRAVPNGAGGLLDSDTFYGLAREIPQGPRRYIGGKVPSFKTYTAQEQLVNAFRRLEDGVKMSILTGGPVTNIAELLLANPQLKDSVEDIYVLGGAINTQGNLFTIPENTRAEFNMFLDPKAAHILMASGVKVTLVPLDATGRLWQTSRRLERQKRRTAEARLAWKLLRTVHQLKSKKEPGPYKFAANPLTEVVAAVLLADASTVKARLENVSVTVDTSSNTSTQGWTFVDKDQGSHIHVLQSIDIHAFDTVFASALAGITA